MPISDIYGLRQALENVKAEPAIYERHRQVADYVRNTLIAAGYQIYGTGGFANTVTAMEVPEGMEAKTILDGVAKEAGIMLAGSFDVFAGKLIRIGHMGENANMKDAKLTVATEMSNLGGSDKLTLAPNSVMKARVYIWLEGQDPDCIDTASTGKSIDMVLGFTKPSVQAPGP